jgi:hypothetical protein
MSDEEMTRGVLGPPCLLQADAQLSQEERQTIAIRRDPSAPRL